MTAAEGAVVAVDLGATSGRIVLGRIGTRDHQPLLEIHDVHRFPNNPVRIRDGLHWNILELYRNIEDGLRMAFAVAPDIRSIGIDSWAVDYALLRAGRLIGTPYHYRDERTGEGVRDVAARIGARDLYNANGLQVLPFNTLYQLVVDRDAGLLDADTSMLLIPDLITYWLTGIYQAETTNASTTGLLDIGTGQWNEPLIHRLKLPTSLFPTLTPPGTRVGSLTADVATRINGNPVDVIAVGSHDTASAVVAAPMAVRGSAYICSGTWSLIGVETSRPVLSEEGRISNFTNEGGVDGRNRYLRNTMGMWVLNECLAGWRDGSNPMELDQVLAAAARTSRWATFDVNDPLLMPSGDMPSRVTTLLARSGLADPSPAETVRSILESLAASYATTIDTLQTLTYDTNGQIDTIHLVGGASQNTMLCQLIADRTGRTLTAGPVEATAIGNILLQARAAGLLTGQLEDLRTIVRDATQPRTYTPTQSKAAAPA